MNLFTQHDPTVEEEARTEEFIVSLDLKKSKIKGDAAWREADQITGQGDHTAEDEGEPPHDYETKTRGI